MVAMMSWLLGIGTIVVAVLIANVHPWIASVLVVPGAILIDGDWRYW